MTVAEAYRVVGAEADCDSAELEQLCRTRLQGLYILIKPGHSTATRQQAQQQIAELVEARDVLLKHVTRRHRPSSRRPHSAAGSFVWPKRPVWEMCGGFLLVAFIMYGITWLCTTQGSMTKSTSARQIQGTSRAAQLADTAVTSTPRPTLRVVSVPDCQVELDGRHLGSSGQLNDIDVGKGDHKLVLRQGGRELTQRVTVRTGGRIVVTADFAGRRIRVEDQ